MSSRLLFVLTVVTALTSTVSAAGPAAPGDALARTRSVQLVVDGLRARLSIPDSVVVTIAPNDLVASVQRLANEPDAFSLVLDDTFVTTLADDEIDAAVAHELGHVWIFTHHPYLQTEELANQVALRVVSRDSLERLYQKVWQHGGKGDLQYLPAAHTP
jgi:hypothetical protein